jgi:serine/threonine-protein kinase
MLTGRKLFEGETVSDIIADVLRTEIDLDALPNETPVAVRRLLRRCLEREPRKRLRHIGDALLELEEPRDSEPDALQAPRQIPRSRWVYAAVVAAVAFAVAAVVLQLGPVPDPQPVRRFDLAVDNVDATRSLIPSISPDGSKAMWSSKGSLWVRDLNAFDAFELPGTAGARLPFWSPDNRFVGFVRDDQVWRVAIDGGEPVSFGSVPPQSMTGSGAGSWGGDGKILLAGSHLAGLFSVPAGGGDAEIFTPLDEASEADFHHVARLPGTDAVVVSVHGLRNFGFTLQIVSREGRKVIYGGPGEVVGAPVYSPTGHLLFERVGAGAGIWALPFSLDRLDAEGAAFLVEPDARMPSLGADGTLLFARAKYMSDRKLAWVTEGGGVEWVLDEARPYGYPALSPDQRKIVFQVNEAAGSSVWIHDLDRDTTTKLTRKPGFNGAPLWMPDGKNILFTSDRTGGGWDVYVVASDGSGDPVEVYDASSYVWPTSISAGGRYAVIEELTRDDREDLLRLDLENGSTQVLVKSPFTDAFGSISPDDRWLAYHSDESGRLEVYVRPLESAAGRVQVSSGGGANPMWSKQGDRLLYRQEDRVMVVDFAAKGPNIFLGQQTVFASGVTNTSPGFASADVFDVSVDGSRVLMVLDNPDATFAPRLGVVTGFVDELERLARDAAR